MSKTTTCNVRGKLEAIISEQIERLLASGLLNHEKVELIMLKLSENNLLPNQIESDICKELKKICMLKYDIAIEGSKRLNGFGWSEEHIKSHIKKLMKSKLAASSTIIRTICSDQIIL